MSFHLGLTGSIGMGKSTTAQMFADAGCAIWNADEAVHRMYSAGGAAVEPINHLFPDVVKNRIVDRKLLRSLVSKDPGALAKIEAIVHPLVQADRAIFKEEAGSDILVFDIPLLFETGANSEMDAVACVFVDAEQQRHRVMERGTMTSEQFEQILAKQMPIAEKLSRSDYQIETDTIDHASQQVQEILVEIRKRLTDA